MNNVFYTDKASVRRSFDRAAPHYDPAAVLQQEVARRMAERLDYMKLLGRGVPWQVCADLERLPLATASVDMIWSSLAIQWVNIPDQAFAEFRRVLKPEGMILFSTFGPDTLCELRQSFADLDSATHVNQFIDMHDLGDAMLAGGLAEPVMDMEKMVLTYADLRSLMKDLKAIGAHTATFGRARGLTGKRYWQNLTDRSEQWRQAGRLPASYEVIYGHAWRGGDRSRLVADGRQVIEFVKKP